MEHEEQIRLLIYFVTLFLVLFAEFRIPRRERSAPILQRWRVNLSLVFTYTLLLRFCFPLLAVGFAAVVEKNGWGLFNLIDIPSWLILLLSVLLLDFLIYLQHALFHKVPLFWRLHMVHHSDVDLDVTSGVRFHPIEIFLSLLIKCLFIFLLGAPVLAVFLFESILSTCALFNHGNFKIPEGVEKYVRLVLVTPDVHRIHHSVVRSETDSNFGFSVTWWDRLCGTYCPKPEKGQKNMEIGIPEYRTPSYLSFMKTLILPFIYKPFRLTLTPDNEK